MTRVVVTGYASMDHVMRLDGVPVPGATTRILERPDAAWPRLGGSPAYVAAALVAGGIADALPLSWVGADAAGAAYRGGLAALGVRGDGIATVEGGRTPLSILGYDPGGDCLCLYDAGLPEPLALTPGQAALLAGADWVCLTVGPPAVTDAVLERIGTATRLAWAVKRDARALSPAQAQGLARRADLICFSRAEASFAAASASARRGAIVVETRGAEGASVTWNGRCASLPAAPLRAADPTGAGDTLVGGMLAALIAAPDDPLAALAAGMRAAAELLQRRERRP